MSMFGWGTAAIALLLAATQDVKSFVAYVLVYLVCAILAWLVPRGKRTHAWGLLDTGVNGIVRFRADEDGRIIHEPVSRTEVGKTQLDVGATRDGFGDSASISADGTVLAHLAGRTLSIFTVNPRTGTVRLWEERLSISNLLADPRVAAVGGRGDHDVWLALVANRGAGKKEGMVLRGTTPADTVLKHGEDVYRTTHAAFVGDGLLVLDEGRITMLFPDGRSRAWTFPGPCLEGKTVVAFDVAKVEGRTYLAVLAKAVTTGKSAAFQVIVGRMDGRAPVRVSNLAPGRTEPQQVTVVRALGGLTESLCVLVDTERKPIYPFAKPVHQPLASGIRKLSRFRPARQDKAKAASA